MQRQVCFEAGCSMELRANQSVVMEEKFQRSRESTLLLDEILKYRREYSGVFQALAVEPHICTSSP